MEEEEEEEEEEEVGMEGEALKAMYGEECVLVESFPPNIHLRIKPRTADVSSQQFVEAVIRIQAGPQYPDEPPRLYLVESKGLDEQRQKYLLSTIQAKAFELSSCLMLVALCEEAVDKLSAMNHPDGDCPLCLYPLVPEDGQNKALPFMKLMSCFHCFHSECIIRWWNWLHNEEDGFTGSSSTMPLQSVRDLGNHNEKKQGTAEETVATCPVCRKVFQTKDFEHVLELVNMPSSQPNCDGVEDEDDDRKLLEFDSEIIRRKRFEEVLNLQKEHSGLIEPKKELVVLPGMFLPQPSALPPGSLNREEGDHQPRDLAAPSGTFTGGPSFTRRRNFGRRKRERKNSSNQVKEWIRKEN